MKGTALSRRSREATAVGGTDACKVAVSVFPYKHRILAYLLATFTKAIVSRRIQEGLLFPAPWHPGIV
jgi:hypothetical protein